MNLTSILQSAFRQVSRPHCHQHHCPPQATAQPTPFLSGRCLSASESLEQVLASLLERGPLQGQREIARNSTLDAGNKSIKVDANGGITVAKQGKCGCGKLKLENGIITLPNGKQIPFGNTGAIVIMPDGSKVCAGRTSANTSEQSRAAYAGPNDKVPTNPPGATNVFRLNEAGDVIEQSVQ